jgi:23S rRNA (pseudouridine1915-N3)-methyltransferase
MKILLIQVGGTVDKYLEKGIAEYSKRLTHYTKFETIEIKDMKNAGRLSQPELKRKEGAEILKKIDSGDFLVLLDEAGKKMTSRLFASFIQEKMNHSTKKLIFVIGGAFGFDEVLYQRADVQLSLSDMTFSHRMIRLLFTEQLYRAFTILKGEPYHH